MDCSLEEYTSYDGIPGTRHRRVLKYTGGGIVVNPFGNLAKQPTLMGTPFPLNGENRLARPKTSTSRTVDTVALRILLLLLLLLHQHHQHRLRDAHGLWTQKPNLRAMPEQLASSSHSWTKELANVILRTPAYPLSEWKISRSSSKCKHVFVLRRTRSKFCWSLKRDRPRTMAARTLQSERLIALLIAGHSDINPRRRPVSWSSPR